MAYNYNNGALPQSIENSVVTTTYTASTYESVLFVNVSGVADIFLPASPVDGEYHLIKEVSDDIVAFGTITINGNGYTIGTGTTTSLTAISQSIQLIYSNSLGRWTRI